MEKQKKVVDASVIIKWFAEEEHSDKAIKLRDEHVKGDFTLVIPELACIEVINALRYKGASEEKLSAINKILWESDFKIERISEALLNKAISIANRHKITIYDAIYVAVAQFYGIPLITEDKELSNVPNSVLLSKT